MRRHIIVIISGVVAVTLAVLIARVVINRPGHHEITARCTVQGTSFSYSPEQVQHAATISAIASERELPERALVIALATALQESHLINVGYGDRDSVGLFQQRPSQGWGPVKSLMDPRYSANKFFDALVKVSDWEHRPLTNVAQAVQRSAFPDEYEKWEPRATALAQGLTGSKPAALSCVYPKPRLSQQTPSLSPSGVTERTAAVQPAIHSQLSKHISQSSANDRTTHLTPGHWYVTGWLLAKADELGIQSVAFEQYTWDRDKGWNKPTSTPEKSAQAPEIIVTTVKGK